MTSSTDRGHMIDKKGQTMILKKYDVILHNGKDQFVLVPQKDYEALLERLEDDRDYRDLQTAKKRNEVSACICLLLPGLLLIGSGAGFLLENSFFMVLVCYFALCNLLHRRMVRMKRL